MISTHYENHFYARTEQTVVFFARIENAEIEQLLSPGSVQSIYYSCWLLGPLDNRRKNGVTGHQQVNVPKTMLLAEPVVGSLFDTGYNFRYAPDCRRYPLFPAPGNYDVVFTFMRTTGNPISITYRFEVE